MSPLACQTNASTSQRVSRQGLHRPTGSDRADHNPGSKNRSELRHTREDAGAERWRARNSTVSSGASSYSRRLFHRRALPKIRNEPLRRHSNSICAAAWQWGISPFHAERLPRDRRNRRCQLWTELLQPVACSKRDDFRPRREPVFSQLLRSASKKKVHRREDAETPGFREADRGKVQEVRNSGRAGWHKSQTFE